MAALRADAMYALAWYSFGRIKTEQGKPTLGFLGFTGSAILQPKSGRAWCLAFALCVQLVVQAADQDSNPTA